MDNASIHKSGLIGVADKAIAGLVTSRPVGDRVVITMPLAACTGSLVRVSISEGAKGSFLVTDDGCAFREISDNLYSERSFNIHARKEAEKYGASFDGYSLLLLRVKAEDLKSAIIIIASLAKEVVDATVASASIEKADKQRETMLSRIDVAYSGANMIYEAELDGYSTQTYDFDVLVEADRGNVVFELFSGNGGAVNAAFTKFSDVHQREDSPLIVGVTKKVELLGPKAILLHGVTDRLLSVSADSASYDILAA